MTKKKRVWWLMALMSVVLAMGTISCSSGGDDATPSNDGKNNNETTGGGGSSSEVSSEDLKTPLTLEAIHDGSITVKNPLQKSIVYSVNGAPKVETSETVTIPVVAGDVVCFYGDNAGYGNDHKSTTFACTAECYVYGNVMSLITSSDFATAKELEAGSAFHGLFAMNTFIRNHPTRELVLPAIKLTAYCYEDMFSDCTGLTKAPSLPATEMAKASYLRMFRGCSNLTEAPKLPATDLFVSCYSEMFDDCTKLTKAPELPATILWEGCYGAMFRGCTSLTKAPQLPATMLEPECYENMFENCTSLTEAPSLPALTLAYHCYYEMFRGCTSLRYIKCMAINVSSSTASNCCYMWTAGVSKNGTFVCAASMKEVWPTGFNGIPEGWTVTTGN